MRKFLTKQEIINTLQNLPDLPVVYQLDSDELMSSGITKIEIVEACKGGNYENYQEYYGWAEKEKTSEKVIWIS